MTCKLALCVTFLRLACNLIHRKFHARLQALMRKMERECEQIALAVRSLVDHTEALRLEQAINFQSGPLAGLREDILRQRSQTTKLSPRVSTKAPLTNPLETSTSDQDPWARQMLLTIGTIHGQVNVEFY